MKDQCESRRRSEARIEGSSRPLLSCRRTAAWVGGVSEEGKVEEGRMDCGLLGRLRESVFVDGGSVCVSLRS